MTTERKKSVLQQRPTKGAVQPVSRLGFAAGMAVFASSALANPSGMTVVSGNASALQNGSQFNITASQNAFLNWQSFNIAPGETTTFIQPSSASVVWNQINDRNPSQIWGNLNANGVVVLMNQNGFFFGPNCMVSAAGFVATTAVPYVPSSGGAWEFNGPPPAVPIINYGNLRVQSGGSLFLIADAIDNHGTLSAPDGTLGLYAGKNVLLSNRPDGGGISVAVTLPSGSINNCGQIVADAGSILLNAQTVNQNGLLQANSVQNRNGVIELIASDAVNLRADSQIIAHGDDTSAGSAGGSVTIQSGNAFSDIASSQINTRGGALGGNGGNVEISAQNFSSLDSRMDASAQAGWLGGQFSLDPANITLATSGSGIVPNSGTVAYNSGSGTLALNVNTAFANKNFSSILLQATANITLASGTTWNLSQSTGVNGGQLTLQAGGNIVFGNGAQIIDANNWAVNLMAGVSFPSGTVQSGVGSIWLGGSATGNGSGSIQTAAGNISLSAGKDILVGSGSVTTIAGGSITANALAGNVNTGRKAFGYDFSSTGTGYSVDPNLGGISTAAGGNVTISAGNDITSFLPSAGALGGDAGCGAFGRQAGNVTLTAGHDVVGHFVVANGSGIINAGDDAGNASKMLALSLIAGGWTVNAVKDIMLQEVRDPNGVFNNLGFGSSTTKHFFDYAPDASVTLNGGNSVQLLGSSLPRNNGSFEQQIPVIYPPSLNITAGAGGVDIANDVILFPSPVGQLNITTTAGGSLTGNKSGELVQLIMSDSGASQFASTTTFGANDHAAIPVHVNDPLPVTLNIAGDMTDILLVSPKAADITIGGNMVNSRFQIQNLHPTDVSTLNVAGDILNRDEFTTVSVTAAPDFSLFNIAYPPLSGALATLATQFSYNPTAQTLTFQGRMSSQVLQTLLNLQVEVFDALGNPVLDAQGNPVTRPAQFTSAAALQQLFNSSQDIPLNPDTGYTIAGPGALNVNARNMNLGDTLGIQSVGPANNHGLATLGNSGAAINVNLTGNLDMFSTTISSEAGGAIDVFAQGYVTCGSTTFSGNDSHPRGIFTVAQSDVTVVAGGDISVAGSRIAAYDGGNVNVESLHGNVNAGTGGAGVATVQEVLFNPLTGLVQIYAPTIPGSGILATTFPPPLDPTFPASHNTVGNILVETPQGNIVANGGGILQLALNGNYGHASVTLDAGTRDANGNVVYAGNIDAIGSGVIGANVNLNASGNITGVVVAQQNLNVTANQNVNVTAVAGGNADVSAGGSISGTIVGIGGVSASGGSIDASLLSNNSVSASGNTTGGAQVGFGQANAAGTASQGSQADAHDPVKAVAANNQDDSQEAHKKKPVITRTGRVTVILPKKS